MVTDLISLEICGADVAAELRHAALERARQGQARGPALHALVCAGKVPLDFGIASVQHNGGTTSKIKKSHTARR
jgi:hypothetical protein